MKDKRGDSIWSKIQRQNVYQAKCSPCTSIGTHKCYITAWWARNQKIGKLLSRASNVQNNNVSRDMVDFLELTFISYRLIYFFFFCNVISQFLISSRLSVNFRSFKSFRLCTNVLYYIWEIYKMRHHNLLSLLLCVIESRECQLVYKVLLVWTGVPYSKRLDPIGSEVANIENETLSSYPTIICVPVSWVLCAYVNTHRWIIYIRILLCYYI